jgi:hypothetical protein
MSCVRTPNRLRRSLVIARPVETFFPASEWMPMTGVTAVDFLLKLVSTTGGGEVKPGLQIARTRTDKPDPGRAITDGRFVDAVDLHHYREEPGLSDGAFLRFGFVGHLRSAARGQCAVELEMDVAVKMCGEVLGTKTVEVQPFAGGDDDVAVAPITDWSPTVGVHRLKAVFVLLDNHNDALEYQLVARAACDRMAPDGWVAVEEDFSNAPRGNSERTTGELPVPDAARFVDRSVYQLGLEYRRRAGSERGPRCIVHTLAHCRYA